MKDPATGAVHATGRFLTEDHFMKVTKQVVLGAIIGVIAIVVWAETGSSTPADRAADGAADAVKVTARASADKLAERAYDAAKGALVVQREMRNPDSFQLITVGDMENGVLCYEFRSQNGFGGMTGGHASMVNNVVSVSEVKYKKDCAGKAGADITEKVRGTMEFARTGKVSLL
jgi:hypothetical protein